jgi:Domain of Unknown Function (DUF1080)
LSINQCGSTIIVAVLKINYAPLGVSMRPNRTYVSNFARTGQRQEGGAVRQYTRSRAILVVMMWMVTFGGSYKSAWAQSHWTPDDPQEPAAQARISLREPEPLDFDDHAGYVSLFDGEHLKDWDGDPSIWHVDNGTIVGISTKEHPVSNSYIVYRGFQAKDFDLKLEIKVENGGGSGIQYRSQTGIPWRLAGPNVPTNLNWLLTGPQADFWSPVSMLTSAFTGQFYSENTPEGIIAWRGQVVNTLPGQRPRLIGNIGNRDALGGYVHNDAWNEYLIVARGGTFIHILNGQLMAVYLDDDLSSSNNRPGFVGIELEGVPAKVSVRNIWLKRLPLSRASASPEHHSVTGNWKVKLLLNGIEMGDPQMCTFVSKERRLNGSCSSENGRHDLAGDINGKSISWQMSSGLFGEAEFAGTIDSARSITGAFKLMHGVILGAFSFTARRME